MGFMYQVLRAHISASLTVKELSVARGGVEYCLNKSYITAQDYINLTTLCNSHKDLLDLVATIQESYLKEEEL